MKGVLLGMLTPSANTALAPLTSAMVAGLPVVPVHFGRFRVTEISLRSHSHSHSLGQYDIDPIFEAARLLADAHVDVIAWNGAATASITATVHRAYRRRANELSTAYTTLSWMVWAYGTDAWNDDRCASRSLKMARLGYIVRQGSS